MTSLRPAPGRAQGGCLTWALLLSGTALLLCCCLSLAVAEGLEDPLDWQNLPKPEPLAAQRPLGVALVPTTLPEAAARQFQWRERGATWGVGYGLSAEERATIDDAFQRLAQEFHYRAGSGTDFTWRPPVRCADREWQCVFEAVVRDNAHDILPLTQLFERARRAHQLDDRALTELVVTFVQHITYRLPTEATAAFGMLPPAVVVNDGSGDCDSKALLAVVMLRQLGIDAVMLLATPLGHAALGVALPVTGKKFPWGGRTYAFVEITSPGWVLGAQPPEYDVPRAWKVIPVAVP